ncbi:TonB-dependent receptor plug domain-containing protein [Aequorivita sp. SDUM287046]|uniref:TonB-dependent receptor plug domain-containing protein n=1 Tax=Aequorivita aurantiaca TaxID=3053356 RepID=A0ABT8DCQ5_9FLAO|nr:TonB-dependent receptor plug domain-containing protein [Aequorivita aurantiaca]MDN3722926.1 TonB-dependent receptor plug domain-containing protein [Aequorivita aurantiaca]
MKNILLCTLLFCFGIAQSQALKGKVTDPNNIPLEGVAIFDRNSGKHTHTDSSGNFLLEAVTENDVISFSILGFAPFDYAVTTTSFSQPLNIVLEQAAVSLEQVTITPEVNTLSQIVAVDLKTAPVNSSQEILRKVPGLIIGQHAGGGKAEQIFLRGFDIDHGTDISLSVDGLPVNMVSHAHGQGYSDLHFLIPETIDAIAFGKGPYNVAYGDFATAGFVNFKTLEKLDQSSVSVEYGQFDAFRMVGLFNLLESKNSNAYLAASLNTFNGPFESPQNFNRFNMMAKYNLVLPDNQKLNLMVSHFQSKWDASGQIPQRAVDEGLISRFGAIDDTEGGNTSRTDLLVNHSKVLSENTKLETKAYYSHYDFELFSNFTFYLEDPVNGDQIAQRENRNIMGFQTVFSEKMKIDKLDFSYSAGIGFRYDDVNNNELSHTKNRYEILNRLALGNVDQLNSFAFLNTEFGLGDLQINPAVRLDYYKFDYENKLTPTYNNKSENKLFASPKLNFIYSPNRALQMFLKTGIGFHSNDARVVVANNGDEILPAAYGADIGAIYKLADNLILNTALWTLFLEQEFVYVGDAAIVEPSGKTRRMGVDFGLRYEPLEWLYFYGDINYTYARSTEEPIGENYIPLAPDLTSTGGIAVENFSNFSGGLSYRYIKDRPANENNSIIAEGYFVTDFNINYTYRNFVFGIIIENLFDTEWNETQFATESRLFDEPEPVEEINFTPGTPFFLRGKVTVNF